MPTSESVVRDRCGDVIAGRYTLVETIGRGGASVVYAALDDVTGERVAVKLIHPHGSQLSDRTRREVAALRLLRLPGVVTLQDEGVFDGTPYLVMELIAGESFPGRPGPVSWPELAGPTLSMLETLARVHASGVVHRDLKPSNVLVAESDHVTLLDFGVSWGPALGERLTVPGGIVGTPEYLAPEQLLGHRGDPRSDLYAVGLMLYEALIGELPHKASTLWELIEERRSVIPPPVRRRAPDVPRRVAQTIERLLSIEPDERPGSVGELLHALFEETEFRRRGPSLPRLGDETLVEGIVARLAAGESIDIWGARGSGRTRLIRDIAAALAGRGRSVRDVAPGSSPYSCVLGVTGDCDGLDDATRAEAEALLTEALHGLLASGEIVILDDAERVDASSYAVFDVARAAGGIVRVVSEPTPGCVRLERLSEQDLRPLFAGMERIFHLPEDGARELHRRTGGLPARVAAEVAAWVRAGLAMWEGPRLAVSREALHRLQGGLPVITSSVSGTGKRETPNLESLLAWIALAWPHASIDVLRRATERPRWCLVLEIEELARRHRITILDDGRIQPIAPSLSPQVWSSEQLRETHRRLAEALAPGSTGRLRHLAAAGEVTEVVDEALLQGSALLAESRLSDGLIALEQGLSAARRADSADEELRILTAMVLAVGRGGTRTEIQRCLYELGRPVQHSETLAHYSLLLRAIRGADSDPPEEVERLLSQLPPTDDLDLQLMRRRVHFRLAQRRGPETVSDCLVEMRVWALSTDSATTVRCVEDWQAVADRHGASPLEAARFHRNSADRPGTSRATRIGDLLNAAESFLLADELAMAQEAAEEARAEAAACRLPRSEAQAEVLLRTLAYRMEKLEQTDKRLMAAIIALGEPLLEAEIAIVEAAVAWRRGDLVAARDLASRSVEACHRWGEPGSDIFPRALAILCGASPEEGELTRLEAAARACPDPDTAFQTLGLLALAHPQRAAALREAAREQVAGLPPHDSARRRDLLSPAEAVGDAAIARIPTEPMEPEATQ